MSEFESSKIIVCDDFEELKERFKERFEPHLLHLFQKEEFKVEDAKAVLKEAIIRSEEPKALVLMANKFNIYAQNALLKILEEPPSNTLFFLISKTKSTFLPTILSRLPVQKLRFTHNEQEYSFDEFDLERLYALLKQKHSKSEAKGLLKGMLHFVVKEDIKLNEQELDYFFKALELLELNSNPNNVLVTAGLILLRAKKRR